MQPTIQSSKIHITLSYKHSYHNQPNQYLHNNHPTNIHIQSFNIHITILLLTFTYNPPANIHATILKATIRLQSSNHITILQATATTQLPSENHFPPNHLTHPVRRIAHKSIS